MVERFDDWPVRLSAYLAERRHMPFEWAVNDCLTFIAKAVEATTGKDFSAEFPSYTDKASADDMLDQNGGAYGVISTCLGLGTTEILTAKRGDVVLVEMPEPTAGIVDDSGQFIALVTPQGLRRVPITEAIRVWSY